MEAHDPDEAEREAAKGQLSGRHPSDLPDHEKRPRILASMSVACVKSMLMGFSLAALA
jgi:hypothetical protein